MRMYAALPEFAIIKSSGLSMRMTEGLDPERGGGLKQSQRDFAVVHGAASGEPV